MKRVRPRFHLDCAAPPDRVIGRVGGVLRSSDCPVSGLACPGRIELHVHGREQHLWSPQLIVDVHESDQGSHLEGRFGPHPSVWTMYVAGYAACAFGILLGGSFGYAQWVMGARPWSLIAIPAALLVAMGLYLLAFLGQGAGSSQMKMLQRFLKRALSDAESEDASSK